MSHSELSLKYDGPSVDDGSMDVRDLAPALLAVGNLIEAASRVVNGPGATPRVQVKTVAPGSFTVGLDVTVDFLQSIRDMLISPDGSAAANLITILTGSLAAGGGAIALVRWLGGKRPTRISKQAEHKVEVELDGKTIIVDEIVARVAIDVKVRLAMERVIAEPLSKEGIESVEIGKGAATERVEKNTSSNKKPKATL